ncbi:MAG: TlpA family protein disulfide reductase [Thermoguttaceae bacterium]|jgi:thiol-disulfide isomerase/thioredoxin|nr:TlpA family protein disulfide reductase [Thermoguttaceae bacterium]
MVRHGICLATAALVLAVGLMGAGCRKIGTSESGKPKPQPKISLEVPEKPSPAEGKPAQPAAAAPPLVVPKVALTEQLLATCNVKVGDAMPDDGSLEGLGAKSLAARYGQKLTVLLFWNDENPYSAQALQELEDDVAKPFGPKGVAVVGIHVKGSAEAARKSAESAGAKFPQAIDPAGAFFAKVATTGLPRVYLLDSAGKIVWFDVQYRESTRQDLLTAIKAVLGEPPNRAAP